MQNPSHIFELAEKYLTQQAEIYSRQFFLDSGFVSPQPRVSEAQTLDVFYEQIRDCQRCQLGASRTKFVFGVGNPEANLMCIGEGPGVEEDRSGEPFVGPAGNLLNKILKAIGFTREEVYIANIVKCRPPSNRNPEPEEIAECMPYLKKQIEMVQPKLILALGRVAAHSLLNLDLSMGQMRGQTYRYGDCPVIVTYHPAALLRNADLKRPTWEDVQRLRALYDKEVGDKR